MSTNTSATVSAAKPSTPSAAPIETKPTSPIAHPADPAAALRALCGAPEAGTTTGRTRTADGLAKVYVRRGMVHVCYGKFCAGRAATMSAATKADRVKILKEEKHEGKVIGLMVALPSGKQEVWILLDRGTLEAAI